MEHKNNSKENNNGFDWLERGEKIMVNFLKGMMKIGMHDINERLKEFYAKVRRNLAGGFIVTVGLIFLLAGIAIYLNDMIKSISGAGYLIVGFVAILLGLIIIKK